MLPWWEPPLLVMNAARNILEHIESFLAGIFDVERLIEWIYNQLIEMPYFAQLGIVVVSVIVGVLGSLALLKAITKILIIVIVLIALIVLYQQGVFG